MIFCATKRSGNLLQGIKILDGGASLCFSHAAVLLISGIYYVLIFAKRKRGARRKEYHFKLAAEQPALPSSSSQIEGFGGSTENRS